MNGKAPVIYPDAKWQPLVDHSAPGNLANRNLIVLHITEGSSAASAIATFKASKKPHRVSAHFVIDRDGTVYQLVDLNDTAWHASTVNARSVGIEHAATAEGLHATDAQYTASAKLVAWLCRLLKVTCDRTHIRTHNEASPIDGHVLCCTGGLDPDRVVTAAAEAPAMTLPTCVLPNADAGILPS
jgi:N-acetyl-anhydromuramyl-L-alanine amidase AmpD